MVKQPFIFSDSKICSKSEEEYLFKTEFGCCEQAKSVINIGKENKIFMKT
jgi:hypothetical protein